MSEERDERRPMQEPVEVIGLRQRKAAVKGEDGRDKGWPRVLLRGGGRLG